MYRDEQYCKCKISLDGINTILKLCLAVKIKKRLLLTFKVYCKLYLEVAYCLVAELQQFH